MSTEAIVEEIKGLGAELSDEQVQEAEQQLAEMRNELKWTLNSKSKNELLSLLIEQVEATMHLGNVAQVLLDKLRVVENGADSVEGEKNEGNGLSADSANTGSVDVDSSSTGHEGGE